MPLQTLDANSVAYDYCPRNTHQWKPKINIHLEQGRYLIKTATNLDDFCQVLELRRQVFLQEFAGLKGDEAQSDYDTYDQEADFLMVICKKSGQLLASYRLICTSFSDNFYSSSEFIVDGFLKLPRVKLELSRACVDKDHRSGIMIHLLWKGIAAYAKEVDASYIFGCCSLTSLNLNHVVDVYDFLHDSEALADLFHIEVKSDFKIFNGKGILKRQRSIPKNKNVVPAFLQSYVSAGAKVYATPAFDMKFSCLDFFTILEVNKMSSKYKRKYKIGA